MDGGREEHRRKKNLYTREREERARARERKKAKERENEMTPPTLLQRLCMLHAFCSVQTRVETFATQKKRNSKGRRRRKNLV